MRRDVDLPLEHSLCSFVFQKLQWKKQSFLRRLTVWRRGGAALRLNMFPADAAHISTSFTTRERSQITRWQSNNGKEVSWGPTQHITTTHHNTSTLTWSYLTPRDFLPLTLKMMVNRFDVVAAESGSRLIGQKVECDCHSLNCQSPSSLLPTASQQFPQCESVSQWCKSPIKSFIEPDEA